jgi:hypothetical protein
VGRWRIFAMRLIMMLLVVLALGWQAQADTIVDIPFSQQINVYKDVDAITGQTSFGTDGTYGYAQSTWSPANYIGGRYFGPRVNLAKAGYFPWVDMSVPGTTIEYTARFFQGSGNSNPYVYTPINVELVDSAGRNGGLGKSWCPSPYPSPFYPSWITCTDNMTTEYPTDAGFDLTHVVSIKFVAADFWYKTDWAGADKDFIQVRNLKVSNPLVHNTLPLSDAKTRTDIQTIETSGVVTASFGAASQFYVEDPDRLCGIQVRAASLPAQGATVNVAGGICTDSSTGEMYIQATGCWPTVSKSVRPVGLSSKTLGGGAWGQQQAVFKGEGLSNVGMLVRLFGTVTGKAADTSYAYVSDGTTLSDGGTYAGIRVDLSAIPSYDRPTIANGDKMVVTGISSMYVGDDGNRHRMIRVRDKNDFKNLDDNGNRPKTIRVAVINFDPYCPGYGNKRTHEVFGWYAPQTLTNDYINDLKTASGNWCQYQVVSWYDANYHAYFQDGFQYSPDDYVYAINNHLTMHSGYADYFRLISDKTYAHNQPKSIEERVAADEFDEVFIFGAPGAFSMFEASTAGPSPFFVNGGIYYIPGARKNFVIMGFCDGFDDGYMLEDFCHRTECLMDRVYQAKSWFWPTYPATNNWEKFRMIDKVHAGSAACGFTHYAPNSVSDYDWGNTTYVYSTCDDWLYNWPNLKGDSTKRLVNCTEWAGNDIGFHHRWWLAHLPKAAGVNPDGKQNNWWKYICDFNSYPESR